ncbi:ATP-binding cassette domain-containing protein [Amphritea opalescens]|uniref:Quaternary amine transport ATP-binding protein n=1 Tax=Amphritea opalescens TaxID=2490544 RepID=A0A430KSH0_9GAMM|nr:betaine/proline/choline family ABC transporter ATP-binding protein [Amphritea opalescens]RTE66273.1 ATP-binding cassette domain-containing protein [Amphritea opalescens]
MTKMIKVSIKNLYKIFGPAPQTALEFAKQGVEKNELMEKHGHVMGLKDINVDMKDGDITVIMGLSGSGKSTLIRHFNRLIEPTDGQILIDGVDVMTLSDDDLRKMRQTDMSMVFQKFALLPHKTVLENAGTALRIRGISANEADVEAIKWLDRVGLSGFENHYPSQLSGGMQQRVGIARALTSNAAVMLMDEAFSALDPLIRTDMQDLLLELQKELHKTIIFISHDLDEALKLADHLVILKDGEVIQQGEPQAILLNPADPYIENFVSDINRARVLRVRSVMHPLAEPSIKTVGQVDYNDTLESVISHSDGDTNKVYQVMKDEQAIGTICMKDLVRALVPRTPSDEGTQAA